MERRPRDGGEGEEGDVKELSYVHVPTLQEECDYYALCADKKKMGKTVPSHPFRGWSHRLRT